MGCPVLNVMIVLQAYRFHTLRVLRSVTAKDEPMGEIADMMLDGTLCLQCGVYIPEEEHKANGIQLPAGYPIKCNDCKKEETDGRD